MYLPTQNRNMYALLSPFSIIGWLAIGISCYVVGLVIWLSHMKFNPYFWVVTVVLEQNDDHRNTVAKSSVIIILLWLFVALLLRNVYTANIFAYMTLEPIPNDLPRSLDEVTKSQSTVLLTSFWALKMLISYTNNIDDSNSVKETNLYHLGNKLVKKSWEMLDSFSGPFQNIYFENESPHKICKYANPDLESCVGRDKIAYMIETGPLDQLYTARFMTGKLLLALNQFRILENNEHDIFVTREFVSTNSDNFLKYKFEGHLGSLVESGIGTVLKDELFEKKMREHITEMRKFKSFSHVFANNLSTNIIFHYISLWTRNDCFLSYQEEVCNLGIGADEDIPVKLGDLTCVWTLLFGLLVVSSFRFLYEILTEQVIK